jgi:anti-sigma regulatory factor (Ser/Thr protein kinase)
VIRSAAVNLRTPAAILTHLNDVLLRHDSEEHEPRFATAVLAVVHPRAADAVAVTFAVAGHPLPLLRIPGASVRPVGVPGTALGITEALSVIDHSVVLHPGHTLLCFTDGATERRNGNRFFGEERLAAALSATTGDADTIAATLEQAVREFSPDDLSDDLALLVAQTTAPPATPARPTPPSESRPQMSGACRVMPATVQLPKAAASVGEARRFLRARLQDCYPLDLTDTAILLVSELVTNAVRYGFEPIELELRCTAAGDALRVTVRDANPVLPQLRPGLAKDPGGRGLHLLKELSDDHGVEQRGSGKDVWFTLGV